MVYITNLDVHVEPCYLGDEALRLEMIFVAIIFLLVYDVDLFHWIEPCNKQLYAHTFQNILQSWLHARIQNALTEGVQV